jgi:zinc/manganese transport system ATP-binding protein
MPKDQLSISIQRFQYGSILALKDVTTTIPRGSLLAIIGPNGGGKSSFLKIVAGLESCKGSVKGRNNFTKAYLPQNTAFDKNFPLQIKDVVGMGLWAEMRSFYRNPVDASPRILAALKVVGLQGFENRSLTQLSGGQLQRVLFARIMIQQADLILLDEPFAGVDTKTTRDLLTLIHKWHEAGKTILIVLHDMAMVREHFPETLLLSQTLIAHGPTENVVTKETLARAVFGD